MTTWSAFCSGDPHNCFFKKIYSQVHGHANDLVWVNPTGFANKDFFSVDGITELPVLSSAISCCGGGYALFSIGGDDRQSTGITAGQNSVSIFYLGVPIASTQNAGPFGISHSHNEPNTNGTAFYIGLGYGWRNGGGVGVSINCSKATTFCTGGEDECCDDSGDYSSKLFSNVFTAAVFDRNTNTVSSYLNNAKIFSHTPSAVVRQTKGAYPLNPGKYVHLCAGGDYTQPADCTVREMFITNSAASFTQFESIFSNVQRRYPKLTFESVSLPPMGQDSK
jgi:hypothetical protein